MTSSLWVHATALQQLPRVAPSNYILCMQSRLNYGLHAAAQIPLYACSRAELHAFNLLTIGRLAVRMQPRYCIGFEACGHKHACRLAHTGLMSVWCQQPGSCSTYWLFTVKHVRHAMTGCWLVSY